MNTHDDRSLDDRVVVIAPTRRDGITTEALLTDAGLPAMACATFREATAELRRGAAAIILTEEVFTPERIGVLATILEEQPPWSDLPVLVLTHAGANSMASREAVRALPNVTLLERPVRVTTLLSAVRAAVRARERQYQIRGYLHDRTIAEDALRAADQRKDEFLATLAHELRNPLAPLLCGAQLLRLTGPQDARTLRLLDVMERQVTHLTRLVDDLLEISRITRGLIQVHREDLDIVSVLRAAVDTTRPIIDAAGHELSIDLPAAPIVVVGDAVRLTQVFSNLLVNAAKYTDQPGRIRLSVTRDADHVRVSISDNGIGLSPADLPSIFDMFTQLHRFDRRAQSGLGIGLTLVKSLVEMHGGRVDAQSAGPDQGSTFVVTLPSLAHSSVDVGQSVPLREFPNRRILIVDDSPDAGSTLGELLEMLGATVSVANSGRAALEDIDRFAPDMVLLDLGMPEMNGYEVARRIRERPQHADTLLVALTGWGQERDRDQSWRAGFDHHFVKPPDVVKLRDLLLQTTPPAEIARQEPSTRQVDRHSGFGAGADISHSPVAPGTGKRASSSDTRGH